MKLQEYLVRFGVIILLIGFCSTLLSAEEVNSGQPERDYKTAQDSLLTQLQKGVVNAELYNQLGLTYYHQGKSGLAVLNFMRALRIDSSHKDAKNNLEYAINQSPDRELYAQPSFLATLFQRIFEFFNLNSLAFIVIILLILTTLCLHWIMHLSMEQDKAVPLMWLIIVGFVFLLSVTMLGLKYRDFLDKRKAVVIETTVEGFSGPGKEFGRLFTIHDGLIIHISRIDKDWTLITLPNSGAGWILTSSYERVKP